ncbi:MAG: sulfite exporter TauE/SafE family protein [Bacteroidales bacterium]|nr:sulfite exporter TauE/SafE family protein [Candidatus Colicola faecequi]
MLDFILHTSTFPLLTAFVLGLLTMISPCPFCSDVTAISFISKNVSNKRAITMGSLCYVLGKCFSYTLLAFVFILGAQIEGIRRFFETYGEPALGPFLIVMGVVIALFSYHEGHHDHSEGGHHEHDHAPHKLISKMSEVNLKPLSGPVASFILGAVFALAFCPYSGLLYFGTLIPLTMMQPMSWGWLMPILFGLGDALPVMLLAVILSRGFIGLGKLNGNLQRVEAWLRRFCIVLFIGMGIYMTASIFGGHHHHHDHDTERLEQILGTEHHHDCHDGCDHHDCHEHHHE